MQVVVSNWILSNQLYIDGTCTNQLLGNDTGKNKARKSVINWPWFFKTSLGKKISSNRLVRHHPHKICYKLLSGRDLAVEKP